MTFLQDAGNDLRLPDGRVQAGDRRTRGCGRDTSRRPISESACINPLGANPFGLRRTAIVSIPYTLPSSFLGITAGGLAGARLIRSCRPG
jgi:hypothetical protein